MKKAIATALVCSGLALVGASEAQAGDGENSGKDEVAKACTSLQKADKVAFRATYGPKHAMKTCKKGAVVAADETTPGVFKNAAKECRSERDSDPAAFQAAYGSNKNGKNAFGKCVSSKVKGDYEEEPVS
ncbi:MAG: hypothetical protein M3Y34_08515 [Actinomycetota bacterium]|nr:hypothetical protein [Actinomycetota bacterium]